MGVSGTWKQYEVTLQTGSVTPTTAARYVLAVDRPGTVWFGLASLFPPTFKNQPNGFRTDIMQMMVDMKPKFLRFPGRQLPRGDRCRSVRVEEDARAALGTAGPLGPWGYRSSDGLGLHEFLLVRTWPPAGARGLCRLSLKGVHVNPGTDLEPYVQDQSVATSSLLR